jgi:outer membrane protein assembly factor BamB
MGIRRVLGVLGIVGALVAGPVTTAPAGAAPPTAKLAADWAQDGYGPGNTAANLLEHTITKNNVAKLRYRGSLVSPVVRASCLAQLPPVVAGGRMFLSDAAGFSAYNAVTGARLWRHTFQYPSDQEPPLFAVSGSTLLASVETCGSNSDPDSTLTAYDAATGAVRWSFKRDAPMTTMVVDDGLIAVGGGDAGLDEVGVYRLSDGARVWSRPGVALAAGVSANGRLLLTRLDHTGAVAVRLSTGSPLWTVKRDWSVVSADPAGQRFLVSDPNNDLTAVDAASGAVRWTATGASGLLATDGTRVYVTHEEHLRALRAADGRPVWDVDLQGPAERPTVAGNVVYAPADGQFLTLLDPATGESLDDLPMIPSLHGHVVVCAGRLYATDGRVLDMYTP